MIIAGAAAVGAAGGGSTFARLLFAIHTWNSVCRPSKFDPICYLTTGPVTYVT